MTKRFSVTLFGKQIFIAVMMRNNRKTMTLGVGNRTHDGKYVPFLDYDRVHIDWIVQELTSLQKKYKLSTFYIFKSSEESYHAICLTKMSYKTWLRILEDTTTDPHFRDVPRKFGKKIWVLRFTPKIRKRKPTCIKIIKRVSRKETSKAHRLYLQKVFNLRHIVHTEDAFNDIIFASYRT